MKLLAGNSNRALAEAVASHLDLPLTKAQVKRFADNEVWVTIDENVRGEDVFVLQSTSYPTNDNLMELLICIDALRRASAKRITAVMPYFGYARQDRKTGGRTPISAKLVSNLIDRAGADRVLTMDLHSGQIQGFFDIPTDNLVSAPLLAADIKENYEKTSELMIVSPDVGGVVRALAVASRLNAELAIVDKRRSGPGKSEVEHHRRRLGTPLHPVRRHRRFRRHPVQRRPGPGGRRRDRGLGLCHPRGAVGAAIDRVNSSILKELVMTDSISAPQAASDKSKLRYVSCDKLLGEAIRRIANEESVSKLFD
jgi:ribose-phosphate pyrophosphokinase